MSTLDTQEDHPTLRMSLRDWFAGQAMQAYVTRNAFDPAGVAREAYAVADAMLIEREKVRRG